jgi:hypothetical protein
LFWTARTLRGWPGSGLRRFGYRQQPLQEPYLMLLPAQRGASPELALQRVPEPKVGKNRMHVDLHVEDVEGEVARLVALGATPPQRCAGGGRLWLGGAGRSGGEDT